MCSPFENFKTLWIEFFKGSFINHVDRNLDIFDSPPPLWSILLIKAYVVTWTFGKPSPPFHVLMVYKCPLKHWPGLRFWWFFFVSGTDLRIKLMIWSIFEKNPAQHKPKFQKGKFMIHGILITDRETCHLHKCKNFSTSWMHFLGFSLVSVKCDNFYLSKDIGPIYLQFPLKISTLIPT